MHTHTLADLGNPIRNERHVLTTITSSAPDEGSPPTELSCFPGNKTLSVDIKQLSCCDTVTTPTRIIFQ